MIPTTVDPLLVPASQAAQLLGVSRSFFYQLLSTGRIPIQPVCFGRKRLWNVEKLKQWADDGCPTNNFVEKKI